MRCVRAYERRRTSQPMRPPPWLRLKLRSPPVRLGRAVQPDFPDRATAKFPVERTDAQAGAFLLELANVFQEESTTIEATARAKVKLPVRSILMKPLAKTGSTFVTLRYVSKTPSRRRGMSSGGSSRWATNPSPGSSSQQWSSSAPRPRGSKSRR